MTPAWLFASLTLGLLAMAAITVLILAAVDGFPAGAAGAFTTLAVLSVLWAVTVAPATDIQREASQFVTSIVATDWHYESNGDKT